MSVLPRLNLLHVCSPLRVVRRIPRLLGPASSDNIRRANSVSIMDFEPAIMSEFSSDVEPDLLDALRQVQLLPAPVRSDHSINTVLRLTLGIPP